MTLINATPFFKQNNDILFGRDGFTITGGGTWDTSPGEAILTTSGGGTDAVVDAVNGIVDAFNYEIEFELEIVSAANFFVGLASSTSFAGNGEHYNHVGADIRTSTGAIFHSFGGPLLDGDKLRFVRKSLPSHTLEIILNDVSVANNGIAIAGYTPFLGIKSLGGSNAQGVRNFKQIIA